MSINVTQSVVRSYAPVTKALARVSISFKDLVDLARKAEIPYPLFFAPRDVLVGRAFRCLASTSFGTAISSQAAD